MGDDAIRVSDQVAESNFERKKHKYPGACAPAPLARTEDGMGRTDGSHWYYSYLPMGISGGATSTLIPLFAYALGGNLFNVGIIAAVASVASVPAFIMWGCAGGRRGRMSA